MRSSVLVILGTLLVLGIVLMGAAATNATGSAPPATKVAYAAGYATPTPTATPTEPPLGHWLWGQLPPELREAYLRRLQPPPPPTIPPAEKIDFGVGKAGCRFTVDRNATADMAGRLAGDCVEIIRALNPTPAPTPTPTATPSPTQAPVSEYVGVLHDPRPDGGDAVIEVRGQYGRKWVTLRRELKPGSEIWQHQAVGTKAFVVSGAVAYITEDEAGKLAIELDYYDGSAVRSDIFTLDEIFPLAEMIGLELNQGPITYTVTAYPGGHVISFKETSQTGNVRAKDLYINDAIEQFCGIWIFGKDYETLRISYNCGAPGNATFREWKLEELFPLPR